MTLCIGGNMNWKFLYLCLGLGSVAVDEIMLGFTCVVGGMVLVVALGCIGFYLLVVKC